MAEVPPVFSHDVKIEQTAKGARVTVHVHTNDPDEAMAGAVALYQSTKKALEEVKEAVAPTEVGKGA